MAMDSRFRNQQTNEMGLRKWAEARIVAVGMASRDITLPLALRLNTGRETLHAVQA